MSWFRWENGDLLLRLKIQPGASRSEFAGMHGECLKLRIHAPAQDGRANTALLDYLSTCFDTNKSSISIERGQLGRIKSVRIHAPGRVPDALLEFGLTISCSPKQQTS